ncbi:MAG: M23 family metallopeptidase [Oscillospiraceae bacterium]|nr:M23 family metallopeptidase [Oscillospiraceae bacterium]MBQ5748834.1 M23 family metallopeptidase [Oscillospiraceae bacterium]
MQHNQEKSNSGMFRKFFQDKGYYIVLSLCIIAVGISGYLFVSGAIMEKNSLNEETLSVATPNIMPQQEKQAAEAAEETAAPTVSVGDEAVREQAQSVRIWPVSGQAVADYSMDALSYNTTTRDWRTHDGMDLAAVSGEPVYAAGSGTVSAVYDDEYFGTTVSVLHADGCTTHYANLAAMPTVQVGDKVEAGDVLGSVGNTALLEVGMEPHLHFAVSRDGVSVDPMDFLD